MPYQKVTDATVAAFNEAGFFNVETSPNKSVSPLRAMDGGLSSALGYNAYMPAGILTEISPTMIEIVTRKRTIEEITGGRMKLLDWEQNEVLIPIVEKTGETKPYSDFGEAPNAGVNMSPITRGHYRFFSAVTVGSLFAAQLSKAKVSADAQIMNAALEALFIEFNRAGFFGATVDNGSVANIYGLLNDPALPSYETTTATKANATFMTWYNENINLVQQAIINSGNHLSFNSPWKFAIANDLFSLYQLMNDIGNKTVQQALKEQLPNAEFILIPEFVEGYNNNSVIYLVGENTVGGVTKTLELGFSELALGSAIEQRKNNWSQDMKAGTCGVVAYKPFNVVRAQVPA